MADVDCQHRGAGRQVLGLVDLEILLGEVQLADGSLEGILNRAAGVDAVEVVAELVGAGLRQALDALAVSLSRVIAGAATFASACRSR